MIKKISFIKLIQFWGIIILIMIGGSIITLDIFSSYQDFNSRANHMRSDYITRQKQMVKREVDRVADMINYEKSQSEKLVKSKIKMRVYEAYAIAQNIYNQSTNTKSKTEIQQLIINALSPVRFEQEKGYYFISRLDGTALLFPSKPELVGINLINVQDTHKQFITKGMFKIAEQSGEGFYEYHWAKPNYTGKDFIKISFIKQFEPYNWIIGTGLYVEDVKDQIKIDLLTKISAVRYGKEGYIFVNRLNGDALISNGKLFNGTKKLWELFNKKPEKIKNIFEMEYKAALKPDGDYIYYSWEKLTDSKIESPKTSFVYGIPDLKWLVGSGVYLDDVEKDINVMQIKLNNQIKAKLIYSILIVIGIVMLFLFLFNLLTRKLKNDFNLFISFFNKSVNLKEEMNRSFIQFTELDQMAVNANEMLQNLQKSETHLHTLTETIPDLVWLKDPQGIYLFCNPRVESFFGVKESGIIGKTDYNFVDKELADFGRRNDKRAVKTGRPCINEEEVVFADDGHKELLETIKTPMYKSDGTLIGVLGIARDITEHKRAEEKLKESEENYRDLFNENPLALLEEDFSKVKELLDGIENKGITVSKKYFDENPKFLADCISSIKILNYNKASLDLLKYKNTNELMQNFSSSLNENSLETFKTELVAIANNEKYFSEESELVCSDGQTISVMIKIRASGDYKKVIVSVDDITKLKKAEEKLQKLNKLKSIGNLAGGIAHDFNNILMGLFGNISIAKTELTKNHSSFKYLEEAEKSMNRATRLTKQLLTFAKGGAPIKEIVSIGQLAKEVIDFDLSGSNVKLVFKQTENLWMAKVDGGQMQQVFSNLTINADQAMPDGGHLYITLENVNVSEDFLPDVKSGKYIKIIVRDEGVGIDQKYLDRIFDPYFSTKQTGSGLGLATVYSIIHKHGGFISVNSKQGKGTIFTLYLPASKIQQQQEEKLLETQPYTTKQKAKILAMDDEEMILCVTSKMLKKFGFSVETAPDGKKAIEMYKRSMDEGEPFDIVIMDLTIPGGMGGEEAIKELLAFDPNAKAIVSSGYAEDHIVANYAEHGFKAVVSKPYNINQLRDVLCRILKN